MVEKVAKRGELAQPVASNSIFTQWKQRSVALVSHPMAPLFAGGELEITDVNRVYLSERQLDVRLLGRGYAWLDTGTFDAFHKAAAFVQAIQERQGIKISCIEEIANRMGYLDSNELLKLSERYKNSEYGEYLRAVALETRDQLFSSAL